MKSVGVAYVFLIFLGSFGAHRFYLGNPFMALVFIASAFGSTVGVLIDTQSGNNSIYLVSSIVFVVLFVFDLFTLAGKVRRYNARSPLSFG